jgi:hyperosmotically inducible periplasmic protein
MRQAIAYSTILIAAGAAFALSACSRPGADSPGQPAQPTYQQSPAQPGRSDSATQSPSGNDSAGAARANQPVPRAAADVARDATITAQVSSALSKDQQLTGASIVVDTQNGHVQLTGSAPTANARDRATVVASAVGGVESVDNELTVSGAA